MILELGLCGGLKLIGLFNLFQSSISLLFFSVIGEGAYVLNIAFPQQAMALSSFLLSIYLYNSTFNAKY